MLVPQLFKNLKWCCEDQTSRGSESITTASSDLAAILQMCLAEGGQKNAKIAGRGRPTCADLRSEDVDTSVVKWLLAPCKTTGNLRQGRQG